MLTINVIVASQVTSGLNIVIYRAEFITECKCSIFRLVLLSWKGENGVDISNSYLSNPLMLYCLYLPRLCIPGLREGQLVLLIYIYTGL